MLAAIYNQYEAVKLLLRHRLKLCPQQRNKYGNTVMHLVFFKNLAFLLGLLLRCPRYSFSLALHNEEGGNTALHLAVRENNVLVLQTLTRECEREAGRSLLDFDLDARNDARQTVLDLAAGRDKSTLLALLARLKPTP